MYRRSLALEQARSLGRAPDRRGALRYVLRLVIINDMEPELLGAIKSGFRQLIPELYEVLHEWPNEPQEPLFWCPKARTSDCVFSARTRYSGKFVDKLCESLALRAMQAISDSLKINFDGLLLRVMLWENGILIVRKPSSRFVELDLS